ncbi:hypothetical protein BT69DRAFT_1227379 [Atractiella rhizophila]|nr:hypothetical protein BT69DRAFT_1227379 [Atractiella rhizophila]
MSSTSRWAYKLINGTWRHSRLPSTVPLPQQRHSIPQVVTGGKGDIVKPPPALNTSPSKNVIFGFAIPRKPIPPTEEECCQSGCAVCVYDLFEEEKTSYKEKIAQIQDELKKRGIKAAAWPEELRMRVAEEETEVEDPSISALKALEEKLRNKK